jgi:predicted small metal-binding protein
VKGGIIMAQREYKQLSCREAGADCDFLVRAETGDEVMSLASEHACRVHQMCTITPEMMGKMQSLSKSVWCDKECTSFQKTDIHIPHWG